MHVAFNQAVDHHIRHPDFAADAAFLADDHCGVFMVGQYVAADLTTDVKLVLKSDVANNFAMGGNQRHAFFDILLRHNYLLNWFRRARETTPFSHPYPAVVRPPQYFQV